MSRWRLKWLRSAIRDTERLDTFVRAENAAAAARSALVIAEAASSLRDFPELGRPSDVVEGFRDLFIPFGRRGYIMRYRLDDPFIVIVRIWHARERGSDD